MAKKYKMKSSGHGIITMDSSLRKLKTVFEDQFLLLTRGNVMNNVRKKVAIVNYDTLRNMAAQLSMVSMIINAREDQITPFLYPARRTGDPGFVVSKKGEYDPRRKSEDKKANIITEMIQQTGFKYDPEREDDFIDFGKMFIREALTIDQVAVELQYNKRGEVAAFWLVDGATVHRCTSDGWEDNPKYKFVQEVDGQVVAAYTQEELIFDYMYKRVDIKYRGYGYCLPGYTKILTNKGYVKIKKVVNKEKEYLIWNGNKFSKYKGTKTSKKKLINTYFNDGSKLPSSLDHGIKSIDKKGNIVFKKAGNLKISDWVIAENNVIIEKDNTTIFDSSFWEILGWAIGDGNFYYDINNQPLLRLFYYMGNKKGKDDREAFEKHCSILNMLDVKYSVYSYPYSKGMLTIGIRNKKLLDELHSYGFKTSKEGKDIPPILFNELNESKQGLLRGLFSSDGHLGNNETPIFQSVDEELIRSTKLLLSQIGIKSNLVKKKTSKKKGIINGKVINDRGHIHHLAIADKELFFKKIGFIQEYKNVKLRKRKKSRLSETGWRKHEVIPSAYATKLLENIDTKDMSVSLKRKIRSITNSGRNTTSTWFKKIGIECKYEFKQVSKMEKTNKYIDMYDIEILEGEHQFVAEGIYVHNSLLEQAIDLISTLLLGLRYNRDLFIEEKIPKGFLAVQGEADDETIDAITRYWTMAMTGAGGKFKIPVIPTGKEGTSMDFKLLGQSNRDMEYAQLMKFFLGLFAAVFGMDLAELGLKTESTQNILSESSTDFRQEYSKSRALKSLLGFKGGFMNKIIRKIDPDYEFMFVGIDPEDEDKKYSTQTKAIAATRTINEMREEDGKDPLEGEEYDMVLNTTLVQAKGQAQQAEMGEEGGEEEGEEEYEDEYESEEEDQSTSNEDTKLDEEEIEKSQIALEQHLESLLKAGYEIEV